MSGSRRATIPSSTSSSDAARSPTWSGRCSSSSSAPAPAVPGRATPWTASSVPARSSAADAAALREAYRFCARTRNRWHLVGNYLAGAGGVVGSGADALPRQPELQSRLARSLGHDPDRATRVLPPGDAAQPQGGRAHLLRPVRTYLPLTLPGRPQPRCDRRAHDDDAVGLERVEQQRRARRPEDHRRARPTGARKRTPSDRALGHLQAPAYVLGSRDLLVACTPRRHERPEEATSGPRCGLPIRTARGRRAPAGCSWRRAGRQRPAQAPRGSSAEGRRRVDVRRGRGSPGEPRNCTRTTAASRSSDRQENQQQRDVVGEKRHLERQS